MKASQEQYAIGAALIEALEPLIDVCLTAGITSPELEKILRAAFVARAFEKLPKHPKSGRPPTANKVAFATGLNWSDISKVRSAPRASAAKKLLESREQSPSKAARVLEGWLKDPAFLTSGGHPLDLPIKRLGKHRSFKELVTKYAPSTPFGTLLKELTRRGHVQVLDGEIVRFKRATAQRGGMTPAAIADVSQKVKRLADNLYQGLNDQNLENVYEESEPLKLSEQQAALIRPVLERRVKAFLKSVENEFGPNGESATESASKLGFGVSVFSWKDEKATGK
jgi:hypothetical protein